RQNAKRLISIGGCSVSQGKCFAPPCRGVVKRSRTPEIFLHNKWDNNFYLPLPARVGNSAFFLMIGGKGVEAHFQQVTICYQPLENTMSPLRWL
ncbi:MAG: hypothetical protein IKC77_02095, partial [Lentisphaeria bacterium]|nr:hypothetical protein [Lentisphaeria bacterium]